MSLEVTQLIGFGTLNSAASAFGNAFTQSLNADDAGYATLTIRTVFQAAALTAPSGTPTQVRVRFVAHSTTEGVTISSAYIGHRASSGDTYDYASAPTQLLFGGSGSTTIAAGASATSDTATFSWDKTSGLVVAVYIGTSTDSIRVRDPVTNVTSHFKAANDVTTVNATGYTLIGTNTCALVDLIEMDGF